MTRVVVQQETNICCSKRSYIPPATAKPNFSSNYCGVKDSCEFKLLFRAILYAWWWAL